MKNVLLVGLAIGLVSSVALADDGEYDVSFSDWMSLEVGHSDKSPWKGQAFFTVQNTSSEDWGDFHFEIVGAEGVYFTTEGTVSSSAQGATYQIDPTGTALDFEFYANPILPNQFATFTVYTDNTENTNAWFGISMWPTPVPEPASLLLLSLGGLALIRRR